MRRKDSETLQAGWHIQVFESRRSYAQMIDLEDPKLANQGLMAADPCRWAEQNRVRLLGGVDFSLEGCRYMEDIILDDSDEKVLMKSAQARGTTAFMIDAIHGLIYNKYPQGVIYYFPTEKAVEDFSKKRFTPLVADNPCIKKYLKDTNSVSVKKVGKTFLSLLGARATQKLQGSKSDGTSVRQTPADYVIRDERDLFEESMVRMTKDRLQNSKIGKEADLGTPTIPDFGISRCFNDSDQRTWQIRCNACNHWNLIVDPTGAIEFPVSCIRYKDNMPYLACLKCERSIDPKQGEWVKKFTDRYIAGWHISQFMNPNMKLRKIMDRWEKDQRDGKVGEFYNGVLGVPYIPAEDRLNHSDVYACCGNEVMRTDISISKTAMGFDVGKHYHTVLIAEKIDAKRAKIIYMARVKGFQELHNLRRKYNSSSIVGDRRPYEEEFENFQRQASNDRKCKSRVYGAEYHDRQTKFMKTDEKAGTYSLLRNQIFDKSHAWVKKKQVEIPRKCAEVDEFVKQVCNCAKVLEENEQGDRVYRYIKLGDDHYRSALNYLMLALEDLTYTMGMSAPGFSRTNEEYGNDWNPLRVN